VGKDAQLGAFRETWARRRGLGPLRSTCYSQPASWPIPSCSSLSQPSPCPFLTQTSGSCLGPRHLSLKDPSWGDLGQPSPPAP
jgi:hypothetical protein